MKFKIVFGIVMVTCMVSIYSIITTIAGGISENKAGLTRLNKSFLSLSEAWVGMQSLSKQPKKVIVTLWLIYRIG